MRKYYLFIIKNNYFKNYQKKPNIIYKNLENIYKIRKYDFPYGINLYHQLCQPFGFKILTNYINNKFDYKKISEKIIKLESNFEVTYIQINYSSVIIVSSENMPEIFKTLYIYNKNIFVCDFINQDYFWLTKQIKLIK
ncbi:MAG: hypothetical protein ACK5HP_02680 [Bacilli bacterium]